MRELEYEDSSGRKWLVKLPDDVPDSQAHIGVPLGPPSLASLGLPEEVEVRIHNGLYRRKILTSKDVRKRRMDVITTIQQALNIDVERIYVLYLDLEEELK